MKVVITGHSRGIGKGIYEYFVKNNYEVIGFSKSNGYDISDENIRNEIILECLDSNIFVNNAYNNHDESQLFLLKGVSEIWKESKNIIINISSRNDKLDNTYGIQKRKLNDFCSKIKSPHILNMKIGYVDTERVKNIKQNKMEVNEVVKILDYCLTSNVKIEEIKFRCL